jgi:hypothetical protein
MLNFDDDPHPTGALCINKTKIKEKESLAIPSKALKFNFEESFLEFKRN